MSKSVAVAFQKVLDSVGFGIRHIPKRMLLLLLLARDSMLSTLYAIANPSVCPSVCHTGGSVENG